MLKLNKCWRRWREVGKSFLQTSPIEGDVMSYRHAQQNNIWTRHIWSLLAPSTIDNAGPPLARLSATIGLSSMQKVNVHEKLLPFIQSLMFNLHPRKIFSFLDSSMLLSGGVGTSDKNRMKKQQISLHRSPDGQLYADTWGTKITRLSYHLHTLLAAPFL